MNGYGLLTGNTDMHYGNVAFYLDPNPPLRLAPLYDMVPMFYRPGLEGKLPSDALKLAPPPPEELPIWRVAADSARKYWEQIAHDHDFSSDFRDIAAKNRAEVSAVIERGAQL